MARQTLEVEIGGLACRQCAETVTRVLQSVPGVVKVTVDLDTRWAMITAEDWVREEDIIKTLEGADYSARVANLI